MDKIKNKKSWFTLVELIIWVTIFSIFIMIWTAWFANSLSSLQYIKIYWEEQESMLYDDYMMDQILKDPLEIIKFDWLSGTWFLFKLDRTLHNHSYATLDLNKISEDAYSIGIKKIIPLNDITSNWWTIVFTAPWENDIKKITDWVSILTNTGILNNPVWLLYNSSELYIADTWNSCIRKFSDINNCFIWQLYQAWTDSQSLVSPTYIALTWSIMYISDTYNNKIRKVDLSNTWNIMDTFWDGSFWYNISWVFTGITLSLPTWIAIYGNDLYVSDTWNNRILKLNLNSWSWQVLIWTWEDKTIFVSSWSLTPDMIPISHPTNIKIFWNRLYFTESINWVIKSISLDQPYKVFNEFWSMSNIAYFGDFEDDLSHLWSFSTTIGPNPFSSWVIVSTDEYISYSWNNSLKLIWDNNNNWTFVYGFSWITLSPHQNIEVSFYLKSLDLINDYNISYWFTHNNNYIDTDNYNTWIINNEWNKYFIISNNSSNIIDWFKFEINSWSGLLDKEFLLDSFEINLNYINLIWNTLNKFENNFDYIGSIYIDWTNDYISSLFNWKNYKFNINNLVFNEISNYNYKWIKNTWNKYFFDDYKWQTKLLNIDYKDIFYIKDNHNKIFWLKIEFLTYNSFFSEKYISIKK